MDHFSRFNEIFSFDFLLCSESYGRRRSTRWCATTQSVNMERWLGVSVVQVPDTWAQSTPEYLTIRECSWLIERHITETLQASFANYGLIISQGW